MPISSVRPSPSRPSIAESDARIAFDRGKRSAEPVARERRAIVAGMIPFSLRSSIFLITILLAAGCASVSPFNQTFLEIRSPHFHILSSFSDAETRELARSLEFFHVATLRVIGHEDAASLAPPTRVLAFDDRSPGRPFGVRGEDAYLLVTPDSPRLVIRTSADWNSRASGHLRHRYAHWLLRSLSPRRRPLWFEEGVAQYARTIEVGESDVRIGAPATEHTRTLLEWRRDNLSQILNARDLSGYSTAARADFEARSWALVHMLESQSTAKPEPLEAYVEALDAGREDRALEALGADPDELARALNDYLDKRSFRVELLRPAGWSEPSLQTSPISLARARIELAELALELDRSKLAAGYFERALQLDPHNAQALTGLALASVDRFEQAEATVLEALSGSPDTNDATLLHVADFYARAARPSEILPKERQRRLERARSFYKKTLDSKSGAVAARLGLARTHLGPGEDVEAATPWIDAAKALRPGALEIDLLRAKQRAGQGRRSAARVLAAEVVSRSHSARLNDAARGLLEDLSRKR